MCIATLHSPAFLNAYAKISFLSLALSIYNVLIGNFPASGHIISILPVRSEQIPYTSTYRRPSRTS
jgi:hypothetical protein